MALAVLLGAAGCAAGLEPYRSFGDMPYPYPTGETFWAPRAALDIHWAQVIDERAPSGAVPIVLLHPWGFNMVIWEEVVPALAKERPVILIDLPGHGRSSKLHSTYPINRLAAAVLDVMDAAGAPRAVLAGNSLGGATALAVAEIVPWRVAAVITLGAPGGRPIPSPLVHMARSLATAEALATLSDEAWWLGLRVAAPGRSAHAGRLREDFLRLRGAQEWEAWSRATTTILRSVATYAPPLEQLRPPALVVHGSGDIVITRKSSETLAARLPDGELAVLEGCGHMPEMECPQQLLAAIEGFLGRVGAP